MKIKRITAILLMCALLLQSAAFADGEETETGAVAVQLNGAENAFLSGELSLKSGAEESDEPEVYFRSDISKSRRTVPGVFASAEYTPGYAIVNGRVVYIKEDGSLARNETVNGRDFNIAGSYTTGDRDFDAMLVWIFDKAGIAELEFGSVEQLHELFRWEVNNLDYMKSDMIEAGTHGWELERGKALMLKGKGNCYMFAGLFYELSRAIGFEPVAYSGTFSGERNPHGWVEIEIDGTVYIFDTEICYQQLFFRQNYSANFFMRTEEEMKNWMYVKAEEDLA